MTVFLSDILNLSCPIERFREAFNSDRGTILLCQDATTKIQQHAKALRNADTNVKLDELLLGMLRHAPSVQGRRYVAGVILGVSESQGLVRAAKAWVTHLLIPVFNLYRDEKPEYGRRDLYPGGMSPPTISGRMVESPLREQVVLRDRHRCVITGAYDIIYAQFQYEGSGREVPPGMTLAMVAATHIIPFCFNNLVQLDPTTTREMLMSWCGLDMTKIAEDKIKEPDNVFLLTAVEHRTFSSFKLYFDKDAFPQDANKYQVRFFQPTLLSNWKLSPDMNVEFVEREGVRCPDPEFFRLHAAFAKVLHCSGVAAHLEAKAKADAERDLAELLRE